jgi:hypothetical protein
MVMLVTREAVETGMETETVMGMETGMEMVTATAARKMRTLPGVA